MVVIAAPPCSELIGQDVGNCSTEFTQKTEGTISKGTYITNKVVGVVGFEIEPEVSFPLVSVTLGKVKGEIGIGREDSWGSYLENTTEDKITFSADADDNLIIFDAYLYDRWEYKIVSHPDQSKLGSTVSVNIPTTKKRYAVGQKYYNATNKVGVDENIISVIPGNLETYQDKGAAGGMAIQGNNDLIAMSNIVPSAQGEGAHTSVYTGGTTNIILDGSFGCVTTANAKVCGPSVDGSPQFCLGVTGGTSFGISSSISWSDGVGFTGTVFGIPTDQYAKEHQEFGIFAYRTKVPEVEGREEQEFAIVNYYVEKQ